MDANTTDPATVISRFWTEWFAQSNEQARTLLDAMSGAGDPQQFQRRWLDAMAQSIDGFMRTPAFLEAMQRNLKAMTDLKKLQDQLSRESVNQAGLPTVADIAGLFERLDSAEQEILARLKVIETRLKSIEAKLS